MRCSSYGPVSRTLLLLSGLVLFLSPAIGQSVSTGTCTVSAPAPPIIRAEGRAELVADVVLICRGGQPLAAGAALPTVRVELDFNATVASQVLTSNMSEALALIDEPQPSTQLACGPKGACVTLTGTGNGLGVYSGIGGRGNIFQGTQTSSAIIFQIPYDPPADGGTRTLRFTNLRVNAFAFGTSSSLVPAGLLASVKVTGSLALAVPNPVVTVGFVQPGLSFSLRSPDNTLPQTTALAVPACSGSLTQVGTLRFREAFSTAFRPRTTATFTSLDSAPPPADQNRPGVLAGTESGFYNHALGGDATTGQLGTAGLATSGTRLRAAFLNIPAGAVLYLDIHNLHAGPVSAARMIANPLGAFSAVAPDPLRTFVQIPVVSGSADAVWEVLGSDNGQIDTLDFGVYMGFSGAASTTSTAITVVGSLAPVYSFYGPEFSATVLTFPSFTGPSAITPLLTFVIAPNPCQLLTAIPNPVILNGGTPVTVQIATSGKATLTAAAAPTTSSGGDWLVVTPARGTVPGSLTISAVGVSANSGPLTGTVVVSALGAFNTESIPVTYIPPVPLLTPSSLSFTAGTGALTPLSQSVLVTTQSPGVTVSASASRATTWLFVSTATGVTPANFLVVVNPQGLTAGIYTGTVSLGGAQVGTAVLNVTLSVTPAEALIVPRRATFSYSRAQPVPPPSQTFSITSKTGAQTGFAISTRVITPPSGNWLSASASGTVTPSNVTVNVNPNGLGRGSFVGVVTVTPLLSTPGFSTSPVVASLTSTAVQTAPPPSQNIIVTIGDIAPGPYVAAPQLIAFTGSAMTQIVTVDNSASTNTTATAVTDPEGWLTVNPPSFPTPAHNLMATANGVQLAPKMYTGVLAIDDQAGTGANAAYLDATLTVGNNGGVVISVGQDSVTATLPAGAAPATVTIPVMDDHGAVPVSSSVTGGSPWLSASGGVTSSSTGLDSNDKQRAATTLPSAPVTITLNPSQLRAGAYDDSIQVSSPSALNQAYVAVHLRVMAPPATNVPQITEVVNGASFAKGQAVTPGSLVTLRGVSLAATPLIASTVPLPFALGNTTVTFNGFAAPLLYVSGTQINAQLPWDVLAVGSASGTIEAVVRAGGQTSTPFLVYVAPYSPGIFIDFASNRAIAQNSDGSLVAPAGAYPTSPSKPADVGSVISILCTGLGAVDVGVKNGLGAGASPLRRTLTAPVVLIGGIPAQATFSGLQSQFVGVNQVNAIVPAGVPAGDVSLQLQVGGITTTSQVKVTVGR